MRVAAAALDGFVDPVCAPIVATETPRASRTIARVRIMVSLQAAPGRRAPRARERADDSSGEWKRGDLPHCSLRLFAARGWTSSDPRQVKVTGGAHAARGVRML